MENMQPSICAFCKKAGTPTKEHLWPTSLHRRFAEANKLTKSSFWLARLQKDIPGEPTIKDVCARCNNGTLSKLDSYICDLFDSTFSRILDREEEVTFEYDYHLLKRWLLKISYNTARIHESHDLHALVAMVPYILGDDEKLVQSVQLFVRLVYPEEVDRHEHEGSGAATEPLVMKPSIHRAGHMLFRASDVDQKILRAVHLCSYSFLLAFWRPGGGNAEQDDFTQEFVSRTKGTWLLRASQRSVRLVCDGEGAWKSFQNSRTAKFVFDKDA